jgi:hypothetical protein
MLSESDGLAASNGEPQGRRRFTLLDAMILLAGLGLTLGMGVHLLPLIGRSVTGFMSDPLENLRYVFRQRPATLANWYDHVSDLFGYTFQFLNDLVFGMTPAVLLIGLRRPRPPWRRLLVQPGTLATVSIVFGVLWVAGFLAMFFPDRYNAMSGVSYAAGGTVAVSWILLASCRRWSTHLGWADLAGRILGATAITTALFALIASRI